MSFIDKIRLRLVSYAPSPIPRLLTQHSLKVIHKCINRLDVVSGEQVSVSGQDMRMIRFGSGISLIGHVANRYESQIMKRAARKKGLDGSYGKILTDAVTRYTYPHSAAPYLTMDFPVADRYMFHPQHENFVLEDTGISIEERQQIADRFRPQPGWHCLDIGAFLGHGATRLREQITESGRLICVEASSHNREVIERQMKLNDFNNVSSQYAAIWHTAGDSITFHTSKRQLNAIDSNVVSGTVPVDVPTTSIPALTEQLGQAADLVSLTVNGAEIEAVEGLRKMMPESRPKRIVAPGWYPKDGHSRAEILKTLFDELGYHSFFTKGLLGVAWQDSVN